MRLVVSVVALGACANAPPPSPPEAPAPPTRTSAPPVPAPPEPARPSAVVAPPPDPDAEERAALVAFLAGERVRAGDPLRRVLYTWTTAEQIKALRRSKSLLVRSSSPTRGPDFFQRALTARSKQGDSLATALLDPRYRKARFAWPTAWPTVRGFPGESYGDRLIRVVLSPTALVIELERKASSIRIVDLSGKPVDEAVLRAQPERLAAVVFVNDVSPGEPADDGLETRALYREVVLVNESAIESWEVGTDAVTAEVERGRALAERLAARAAREPEAPAFDAWQSSLGPAFHGTHGNEWQSHYAASVALGSPNYRPAKTELLALAAALAAIPKDDPPLVHRPTIAFPRGPLKASAPVLPSPRPRFGTF